MSRPAFRAAAPTPSSIMARRAGKRLCRRWLHRTAIVVCLFALTLNACLLSSCGSTRQAGVIAAGSTSVQPFAESLAEEFMRENTGITVDVQGGGSSSGVLAAQSGTADIGMSSRELKGDEKSLWSVEIARDGLAVIVNPENPIGNLTLNQVRDIYTTSVRNWSQLGGPNWEIHFISREEGSGTRSAFESLVMVKSEINPKAIIQDSNGAVRQLVADDPAAIGFVSLGLVNDKVKALSLEGVHATAENVINGTYNLSRPFLFITKAAPTGMTRQFIDFTLSAAGKKLLAAEGLITLEDGGAK